MRSVRNQGYTFYLEMDLEPSKGTVAQKGLDSVTDQRFTRQETEALYLGVHLLECFACHNFSHRYSIAAKQGLREDSSPLDFQPSQIYCTAYLPNINQPNKQCLLNDRFPISPINPSFNYSLHPGLWGQRQVTTNRRARTVLERGRIHDLR